jgi:hypothetical protein
MAAGIRCYKFIRHLRLGLVLAAIFAVVAGSPARAQVEFDSSAAPVTGQSGTETAKAVFSLLTGGTALQVVVTNTSTFAGYQNGDIVTGFFFSIPGSPTVLPANSSAIATLGLFDGTGPIANCNPTTNCGGTNVNVGSRWQFSFSSTGFTGPTVPGLTHSNYAVATSGYSGITTPPLQQVNMGTNPPDLHAPNGQMNLGLVGPNITNAASGNPVQKDVTTFQTATFTFHFQTAQPSLDLSGINNVVFTYGTNPDSVTAGTKKTPEPASIALFGVGALAIGAVRRRKAHRATA